jgi:hypothetical protein
MLHTQHYVHLLTYPFRGENAVGKFAIACVVVAAGYWFPFCHGFCFWAIFTT